MYVFSYPDDGSGSAFTQYMQVLAQSQPVEPPNADPGAVASGDPLAQALALFQQPRPSDAEQRANTDQIMATLRGMDPRAPDSARSPWFPWPGVLPVGWAGAEVDPDKPSNAGSKEFQIAWPLGAPGQDTYTNRIARRLQNQGLGQADANRIAKSITDEIEWGDVPNAEGLGNSLQSGQNLTPAQRDDAQKFINRLPKSDQPVLNDLLNRSKSR